MPIFQSIPGLNGLSKNIALDQKWKNAVFIFINASFSSCPDEIDKNEQIQNFYWLVINSLSPASCW